MADKPDAAEQGPWRQKYLDALASHERKERRWAETETYLRRIASRLSLAAEGLDAGLDRLLRDLRDTLRGGGEPDALKDLSEALSQALLELDQKGAFHARRGRRAGEKTREPAPEESRPADEARPKGSFLKRLFTFRAPAAGGDQGGGCAPTVNEVLLQFLERLSLPASLASRAEGVKRDLERGVPPDHWGRVLDRIADLVAALRAEAQREKRELEQFLAHLTERLQELDEHVQGAESVREESARRGRELDEAVKDQVRGIETTVREASELEQIKRNIQVRLDAIRSHMEAYRRSEEERHRRAREEVGRLNRRLQELEHETNMLRTRIQQEHHQALQDPLTGIPNRLAFDERIAQEFARWKRFATPLSVVVMDVDRFKHINDTYGHKAGDKVLRTIAERLSGQLRETDFIARYGGEEFVILMPGAGAQAALGVADKLRTSVEECGFHYRGERVPITISCGIAEFRGGDTPEQVFERADAAMYRAKREGRNRCIAD